MTAQFKTICRNGHDKTNPENIYLGSDGKPRCKACHQAANVRRRPEHKNTPLNKISSLSQKRHIATGSEVLRLFFVLHPDPQFRAVYYSTQQLAGNPALEYYLDLDWIIDFLQGKRSPQEFKAHILKQVNADRPWMERASRRQPATEIKTNKS